MARSTMLLIALAAGLLLTVLGAHESTRSPPPATSTLETIETKCVAVMCGLYGLPDYRTYQAILNNAMQTSITTSTSTFMVIQVILFVLTVFIVSRVFRCRQVAYYKRIHKLNSAIVDQHESVQ